MSVWINFVKAFALKHNLSYGCALSDKRVSQEYQAQKKQKLNASQKREVRHMTAEDINRTGLSLIHPSKIRSVEPIFLKEPYLQPKPKIVPPKPPKTGLARLVQRSDALESQLSSFREKFTQRRPSVALTRPRQLQPENIPSRTRIVSSLPVPTSSPTPTKQNKIFNDQVDKIMEGFVPSKATKDEFDYKIKQLEFFDKIFLDASNKIVQTRVSSLIDRLKQLKPVTPRPVTPPKPKAVTPKPTPRPKQATPKPVYLKINHPKNVALSKQLDRLMANFNWNDTTRTKYDEQIKNLNRFKDNFLKEENELITEKVDDIITRMNRVKHLYPEEKSKTPKLDKIMEGFTATKAKKDDFENKIEELNSFSKLSLDKPTREKLTSLLSKLTEIYHARFDWSKSTYGY